MYFVLDGATTTESYTLALHDALPIYMARGIATRVLAGGHSVTLVSHEPGKAEDLAAQLQGAAQGGASVRAASAGGDRKSTRLNSSHANISYAVFCLSKIKHAVCMCPG